MDTIKVKPLIGFNEITFGMDRETVREKAGREYTVFRKNIFSTNTTDDFGNYHIYYDEKNRFEAVEFFGDCILMVDDRQIYPGTISDAKTVFPDIDVNDGTSMKYSVGITVTGEEDEEIEGVMFARKGYFNES